ncbi:MAG: MFS transporter [Patescibacteria group bacterium]
MYSAKIEVPETQKKFLGLPKNIFFLGLTSFFNDFSSEMVFAAFPAFFTSVLHAGAASLGLVDGIAEAASNFFKIYSGHLSDKFQNRKPLVVFGYSLSVVTRPFYMFVGSVAPVLGLRFLDRVGKGVREAPRDAIISLSIPREELGRSFGYHRAMDTAGAILGPLAAYLILRFYPGRFDAVFMTSFFVGIGALFTLFFIHDIKTAFTSKRENIIGSFTRLPLRFKLFLLSVLILSAGSLPVAIILLKTQSLGLIIADIPLFYMIYNLSYIAFSIPAGHVSDKVGAPLVILAGYGALLVSYFTLNAANSITVLIVGFLILGLFPALTDGVQRAFTAHSVQKELQGGAFGFLNAATGFGALLAGIVGGYLWQTYTPEVAFMIGGVLILLGLCVFSISTILGGRPKAL